MQLRYLQTLTEIGAEQNSTVVFPMPIDIIKPFLEIIDKAGKPAKRQRRWACTAHERNPIEGVRKATFYRRIATLRPGQRSPISLTN